MFYGGQAQEFRVSVGVCLISDFREVMFLKPFLSTDLEGVQQAAIQAPRNGQDVSAKPALYT